MEIQKKDERKKKAFTIELPLEMYQAVKIAAVKANKTMKDLVIESLRSLIS